MTLKLLKRRFLGFTQVAFCAGQEEEKEFPMPGDHLKHCSLELSKVEFWAYQVAENDFQVPLKHMIVDLSTLKKSHFRLIKKQKMSSKCIRRLESSLFRLHRNRILD